MLIIDKQETGVKLFSSVDGQNYNEISDYEKPYVFDDRAQSDCMFPNSKRLRSSDPRRAISIYVARVRRKLMFTRER